MSPTATMATASVGYQATGTGLEIEADACIVPHTDTDQSSGDSGRKAVQRRKNEDLIHGGSLPFRIWSGLVSALLRSPLASISRRATADDADANRRQNVEERPSGLFGLFGRDKLRPIVVTCEFKEIWRFGCCDLPETLFFFFFFWDACLKLEAHESVQPVVWSHFFRGFPSLVNHLHPCGIFWGSKCSGSLRQRSASLKHRKGGRRCSSHVIGCLRFLGLRQQLALRRVRFSPRGRSEDGGHVQSQSPPHVWHLWVWSEFKRFWEQRVFLFFFYKQRFYCT